MGSAPQPLQYTETTQNVKRKLYPWEKAEQRWQSEQRMKFLKQQIAQAQGLLAGNKNATYKFLGLPQDATPEQYANAQARFKGQLPASFAQPNMSPAAQPQTAAQGGIMQARRYAKGGLTSSQKKFVTEMGRLANSGKTLTPQQQARLDKIETSTGRDVSPYTDVGTTAPGDPKIANAASQLQTLPGGPLLNPSDTSFKPIGYGTTDVRDAQGNIVGRNIAYTDPAARAAQEAILNNRMPAEFGQSANMYRDVYSGLGGLTGFQPERISGSGWGASAEQASAAQMAAIKDIEAMKMKYYQMEGKVPEVTTKDLEAYQMAGPGSWTDEGVSSKYMSPYMQGVVDISKRETGREFQKQQNEMASKAARAGAFGGARQSLEKAEAQRNYNQQLEDIQTKGMQSAYESGRSQYGQELNLSQQAALQNLQSKLSTQSQSSQEALQAMLSNQNIDYQTKVQNLAANLGVQQQEAANMLQAAMSNQQTQYNVGATNAQLQNQANITNAQLGTQANLSNSSNALQAAMANQQAGIAGAGVRMNAYGQQMGAAQGLGAIGNQIGNWNQQQIGNLTGLGQYNINLGNYLGNVQRSDWGNNLYGAYGALGGAGSGGNAGTTSSSTTGSGGMP